jgi:hypothetical protein
MGGALQVLGCIRLSRPLGCIESTNRITDFGLHDYSLTHSLTTTHFLLAAAAVQCTCSGEPSGEGLAFDKYFYMIRVQECAVFILGRKGLDKEKTMQRQT